MIRRYTLLALVLLSVVIAACAKKRPPAPPPPPPPAEEPAPAPAQPRGEPLPPTPPEAAPEPEQPGPVAPVTDALVVSAWAEPRRLPPGGGQAQIIVRVSEERPDLDEHVVGHGLAGERGAGGAEREVAATPSGPREERLDVGRVLRAHDGLRDQPVDRRVGRAAQAIDGPREDARRREDLLEVEDDGGVGRAHRGYSPPTGTSMR